MKEEEKPTGVSEEFRRAIEQKTGMPIKYLQDTPLDELRAELEAGDSPIRVVGGNTITHEEVERMLDEALDDAPNAAVRFIHRFRRRMGNRKKKKR